MKINFSSIKDIITSEASEGVFYQLKFLFDFSDFVNPFVSIAVLLMIRL
jgi:hypothetical protein